MMYFLFFSITMRLPYTIFIFSLFISSFLVEYLEKFVEYPKMSRKIFRHFGKFVICILPKAPVLKQEDEIRLPTPKPQIVSALRTLIHLSFFWACSEPSSNIRQTLKFNFRVRVLERRWRLILTSLYRRWSIGKHHTVVISCSATVVISCSAASRYSQKSCIPCKNKPPPLGRGL